MFSDTLVIIPARGGSKGVPEKNIRSLGGKPLLHYTIDIARKCFKDAQICVTTDNEKIKQVAEEKNLEIKFLRPPEFATDNASTRSVMMHAINFYEQSNIVFEKVLLLQPTSPFRLVKHIIDIYKLYDDNTDMVVSVGLSKQNPYFSLFEENSEGFLTKSKQGIFHRRQDCPEVYYFNGSIYLFNKNALKKSEIDGMSRIRKYIMEEKYCLDIDTRLDWLVCEALLKNGTYYNEEH